MKSLSRSTRAAAALLLLAAPVEAMAPRQPRPIDQCTADTSFVLFRAVLRRSVATRDWAKFRAMLADDVIVDFGGGAGKTAFAEAWDDGARTSQLWTEAATALGQGCSRAGKTYEAPAAVSEADYPPPGYRFTFERRAKQWRITAFVAGD